MLDKVDRAARSTAVYSVPPVIRAIKVLRHIAAGHSVSNQTQAARAIGINRTTLLRLLHTLEAEGFIERVGSSADYVLGTGLIALAAQKIFSLDVSQVASPVLDRLAERLGLASHLGILEGRDVLYVLRVAPNTHLVSNVRVGTRLPAHATTMGHAILAHMAGADVAELYRGQPLRAYTAQTATSLDALRRRLAQVRADGIAESRSSFESGIGSIAAPVLDHTGKVVAAINVSGPEHAFAAPGHRSHIAGAVRDGAAEISNRLGYIAAPAGKRARPGKPGKA